jgi:V/A-type H+-transporting ATPase subunit I
MSILKQRKVTLFGLNSEKMLLLEGLQSLGCMHVIPLVATPKEVEKVINPKAKKAHKALRFLNNLESRRRQILRKADFDVDSLVEDALSLQLDIRRASDKKELIVQRLADIEPWGNIDYPPMAALKGYRFWYYIIPLDKRKALSSLELPWSIVYRDNKNAYVVVVSKSEPKPEILPISRVHLGSKSKVALLEELEEVELLLDHLDAKRQSLSRFIYLLSVNIAKADDKAALASALQKIFEDNELVALQGWVPVERQKEVEAFAKNAGFACLISKPEKNEIPPTLLSQPKKMAAAKDLALFYQVPGYYGWDPSRLLFVSFSLFFAMILADAGYGLLLLGGLLLAWKKLGRSDKGKGYRLLGLSMTATTVVYGALVGSYFGMAPTENSLFDQIHIIDLNNFDVMMKLSIIVGAIHIGIANLSMAYVNRHRRIAIAKLGWLLAIYGGLLYWLVGGNSTGQHISYGLLGLGALLIVVFTSERPINKSSDHLMRILEGIFNLKDSLNAFGDVLSYMRLFALGLASASLAITFNDLAHDAYHSISGGGLLIAILILLVGHVLNLALSLMSGVVHGLRLNYIEFYNWGQAEEGTEFQTFTRTEVKK